MAVKRQFVAEKVSAKLFDSLTADNMYGIQEVLLIEKYTDQSKEKKKTRKSFPQILKQVVAIGKTKSVTFSNWDLHLWAKLFKEWKMLSNEYKLLSSRYVLAKQTTYMYAIHCVPSCKVDSALCNWGPNYNPAVLLNN